MKDPRRGKYYGAVLSSFYAAWAVFSHRRGVWLVAAGLTEEAALKLLNSLEKMMESQASYQQNTEKKICHT